ncbi:hypothetical protein F441_07142 [Phytophthora nicotianae CJ01A1]|uniref:Uncharacterized protein n=4 Tax=Phytophthora nicotianae TaxID=4792 RepID=V9FBU5_PHYNI|nr:hypothetical protein F443_07125 [Phytophthora nicotianae P1569]ETO77619.1 hypothetical protein F444_07199 [Phytophthora nicotianae P1976]ETP18664.1 hypothetical protein F441_07142 [Phytophthora nicotianae CJ01A1]ETP46568.1 hypothetical protein F442_07205 [Phytophthora nicotianae P10297]
MLVRASWRDDSKPQGDSDSDSEMQGVPRMFALHCVSVQDWKCY